jgi:hypothetical protein
VTVLQSALEDFYVRYTLMVALTNPKMRGPTLNQPTLPAETTPPRP